MTETEKDNTLEDLPCLYYISSCGTRRDMARVYYYLAAWYNISLKDACDESILWASLGLFQGQPFTEQELMEIQIEKPVPQGAKACALVQYMTQADENLLVPRCCSVCKYSYDYKNDNRINEAMMLHRMLDNPELIDKVSPLDFQYTCYGALGKDVIKCPPFPIHRILYKHLQKEGSFLNKKAIVERVQTYLKDKYNVDNGEYAQKSVDTALKNIMATAITFNDEVLLSKTIDTKQYVPSYVVLPNIPDKKNAYQPSFFDDVDFQDMSIEERAVEIRKQENKKTKEKVEEYEGAVKKRERKKKSSDESIIDITGQLLEDATEQTGGAPLTEEGDALPSPASELPAGDIDGSAGVSADTVSEEASSEPSIELENATDSKETGVEEVEEVRSDADENVSVEQDEEVLSEPSSDISETPAEETVTKPHISLLISGGGEDIESETPEGESSDTEKITEEKTEPEKTELSTSVPKEISETEENESEGRSDVSEEIPESVEQEQDSKPIELLPLDIKYPCEVCDFNNDITFARSILDEQKNAFLTDVRAEINLTVKRPEYTELKTSIGCGLVCKKECDSTCVYNGISSVSSDFAPFVNECSDGNNDKFLEFLEVFASATKVGVEYINFKSIPGLLFCIGRGFYFFNPEYGYSGFLKPLLERYEKRPTYMSMNPIPVYRAFYKLGVYDLYVESLAALYSQARGFSAIAPATVLFANYCKKVNANGDFYANAMPHYEDVFGDNYPRLSVVRGGRYQTGKRLEKALAKNIETGSFSKVETNITGGNYLQYRFVMARIKSKNIFRREGSLLHLTLTKYEQLWEDEKQRVRLKGYFEKLAGNIYAPTARFLDYGHLILITDKSLVFYVTDEINAFYDHVLSLARKLYREVFYEDPDIHIQRTDYVKSELKG